MRSEGVFLVHGRISKVTFYENLCIMTQCNKQLNPPFTVVLPAVSYGFRRTPSAQFTYYFPQILVCPLAFLGESAGAAPLRPRCSQPCAIPGAATTINRQGAKHPPPDIPVGKTLQTPSPSPTRAGFLASVQKSPTPPFARSPRPQPGTRELGKRPPKVANGPPQGPFRPETRGTSVIFVPGTPIQAKSETPSHASCQQAALHLASCCGKRICHGITSLHP